MNRILRIASRFWIVPVAAVVVALVFHPVVFEQYTIANSYAAQAHGPDYEYHGDTSLALRDPAAGANQDEPWLVLIRRSLGEGRLPLVNMSNGLGAPIIETLQPGVFYLLNPVLLLFSPTTPRMFDAFALLHVILLVSGLYLLLRLYASKTSSLAVAILVGLSGIVTLNVNMVHFRCHAWLPLVLYGTVRMARGDKSRLPFFVFVTAHTAQITSGALQEAFIESLLVAAVFLIELGTTPQGEQSRPKRLARMALAATCSVLISAVSVLPYLFTRETGDIVTASSPDRSIAHGSTAELASIVFPGAIGLYPHFFVYSVRWWLPDFSTLAVFLVVAGAVAVLMARAPVAGGRAKYAAFVAVLAIGVAKLAGMPVFDVLQHIPFVCEVLFVKYHLWIYALCAILAATALDAIFTMDAANRRLSVLFALLLLVCAGGWLVHTTWKAPLPILLARMPEAILDEARWMYWTSFGLVVIAAALLYFRPRVTLALLVLLAVIHAVIVPPNGWFPRAVRYPGAAEAIEVSDPNLVDPDMLGLRPRIFTQYQPNQNLIPGFEAVGVFDPVSNVRLGRALNAHFKLQHPMFDLQVSGYPVEPLTREQLDFLRILGVSRVYHYKTVPEIELEGTPGGGQLVRAAMPRVWLLSEETADQGDAGFPWASMRSLLMFLRGEVRTNAKELELDLRHTPNGYEIRVERDFRGELVVQQAYAHAWRFEGRSGRPFLDLFPRWTVDLKAGRTYRVEYVPVGLAPGMVLSVCGVMLAVVSGLFLLRRV